jgi:AcrR family transcriptional regulator
MPWKSSRTHAQGDASRRAILDVTLRIAGERGYVGTTVAQVTKASSLPASSIYWHFGNKDDLLADALEHGYRRWQAGTPPWSELGPMLPRREALLRELRTVAAGVDEYSGFWRMGLLLALETGPAVGSAPRTRFLEVRREATERLRDWWTSVLPADAAALPARPATVLAQLTLSAMDGLFVAHQSDEERDLDPVLRLLAAGLDEAATHLSGADGGPSGAAKTRRAPAPPSRFVDADPESSRTRILRAAADVSAESGYDGATISRICARAGLPASSLYWHFKDKDELLAAVVEHSYQEWFLAQPAWLPPESGTSWQQDLRDHLGVSLRSLGERPLFLRIGHLLLLRHRQDPPAGRAVFVAVRRRALLITTQWFQDALEADPDLDPALPEQLALVVMMLSDGLFFSNQLDTPAWDTDLFADLLVRIVEAAATGDRSALPAS